MISISRDIDVIPKFFKNININWEKKVWYQEEVFENIDNPIRKLKDIKNLNIDKEYHHKYENQYIDLSSFSEISISISPTQWLTDVVSAWCAIASKSGDFHFLEESFICQSNEITHSIIKNRMASIESHFIWDSNQLCQRTFMQLLCTLCVFRKSFEHQMLKSLKLYFGRYINLQN